MTDPAKEEQVKIAVFDVCDTLYYSNTTHDFIRYIHSGRRGKRKAGFQLLNHRFSPLRPALVGFGILTGNDVFRKANIGLLKGMGVAESLALAREFVREFLGRKKIEQTHGLVREFQGKGFDVVICSSSIEPVVRAVAEELGIEEFYSAELEFSGGRLTGRLAHDPTGRKLESLAKYRGNARIELAVSDNLSDASLLRAAKRGIAVVHRADKRRFWKDLDLELIDLTL